MSEIPTSTNNHDTSGYGGETNDSLGGYSVKTETLKGIRLVSVEFEDPSSVEETIIPVSVRRKDGEGQVYVDPGWRLIGIEGKAGVGPDHDRWDPALMAVVAKTLSDGRQIEKSVLTNTLLELNSSLSQETIEERYGRTFDEMRAIAARAQQEELSKGDFNHEREAIPGRTQTALSAVALRGAKVSRPSGAADHEPTRGGAPVAEEPVVVQPQRRASPKEAIVANGKESTHDDMDVTPEQLTSFIEVLDELVEKINETNESRAHRDIIENWRNDVSGAIRHYRQLVGGLLQYLGSDRIHNSDTIKVLNAAGLRSAFVNLEGIIGADIEQLDAVSRRKMTQDDADGFGQRYYEYGRVASQLTNSAEGFRKRLPENKTQPLE